VTVFHANRPMLETFVPYHREQGLSRRLLRPEKLFAPETLSALKIWQRTGQWPSLTPFTRAAAAS